MDRVITIGDVHGCLSELEELLDKLAVHPQDTLVFLGDLVDRGPDPVGVVRYVRQLIADRFLGKTLVLLGNHEEKLCRWRLRESQRQESGRENKMRPPSPERQAQWVALTEEEVSWLRGLPATLSLPGNWVGVHAGLFPNVPLAEQDVDKIIRLRTLYPDTMKAGQLTDESGPLTDPPGTVKWSSLWRGPWSVVYGHSVHSLEHPYVDRTWSESGDMIACVGIDTGCCFGGRLTAAELHSNGGVTFVQVQARRQYAVLGQTR